MTKTVFDTSVLLAVVKNEPGSARVLDLLSSDSVDVLMSTVNMSEAQAVLTREGVPSQEAWEVLSAFAVKLVPFDARQAKLTGSMIAQAPKGVSFGDRACLSLGLREECVVLTADRAWKKMKLALNIEYLRD